MNAIIFDFNRTIYNPETKSLHVGALDCLTVLSKNHTLFLAVKGGQERKELIKSLGIERFFRSISIQEEKTIEQFENCQKMLDPDTDWYVVGDRVRKEIKYGNLCNMTTIWYKNGKFADEEPQNINEEPNFTICNLSEIEKIVTTK